MNISEVIMNAARDYPGKTFNQLTEAEQAAFIAKTVAACKNDLKISDNAIIENTIFTGLRNYYGETPVFKCAENLRVEASGDANSINATSWRATYAAHYDTHINLGVGEVSEITIATVSVVLVLFTCRRFRVLFTRGKLFAQAIIALVVLHVAAGFTDNILIAAVIAIGVTWLISFLLSRFFPRLSGLI